MGVNISEILERKEVDITQLKDKIIAVDAHIFLYQFLTTIRQRDGKLLMDSSGRVTSHLAGLFARNTKLMEQGIRLAYVFDGKPPLLKRMELDARKRSKENAEKKLKEAIAEENVDDMKKFASRSTRLTRDMIEEAKKLIGLMGLPVVQAPSEGEAQAAYMVKNNKAFAVASQDADSLLFGSPRLLRNLSIAGKRKKANRLSFEEVKPEIIGLEDTLQALGIDLDQFIALGILVGTDFNEAGIRGMGPKNALKAVKKYGRDFDSLFMEYKWDESYSYSWTEVFETFKNIPTTDEYSLSWKNPDADKIREFLVEEHEFSEERVNSSLERLSKQKERQVQKDLGEFFH